MKSFLLVIVFLILMSTSQASGGELSSEFLESDTVTYWILDPTDK